MKASEFAIAAHEAINQKYHDKPYSYHLQMVVTIAKAYISIIPEKDQEEVIDACWVHDVIEDTGKTYNDVKKATNYSIAEYAYALTNEKGRTRKDRANAKYYEGIRAYKHATFIKLCDRYANMYYSKEMGHSMYEKYREEMDDFETYLFDGRYQDLWTALKKLANENE